MGIVFGKLRRCCCRTSSIPHPPLRHVLTGCSISSATVPSSSLSLLYSPFTVRGFYPDESDNENQDRFVVSTNLQGRPDAHLFAVFDGHGRFGAQCSAFVSDRLVEVLNADVNLFQDPAKGFESAFRLTNSDLHQSAIDDTLSGTVAIVVLVFGDSMYVANVGDSRAVAGVRRGTSVEAQDLSSDQTPLRKDEYERVQKCGARILNVDQLEGIKDPMLQEWDEFDPPRLWLPNEQYPGTAFTRSVGDSVAESIGASAEPEVLVMKISPEHIFFVVASDGVFEFLSSQDVVEMVAKFADPQDACSAIAAESYRRWLTNDTRTDDITIIVVHIERLHNSSADVVEGTSPRSSERSSVVSDIKREERPNTRHL
ncbi:Protein-serine/threonine phosphatase protein [Dioscorea alata]|uniref:Protein-serine/threonine phosphatase protein n=1 Tax=Dioscorea alata TaxID=55571 RepID=A0ACB7VQX8_DIOAL|nr:Protein-serine/threonine phosphatase protein [Dioscorea alata]